MIFRLLQATFLVLIFSLGFMHPFVYSFGLRTNFTDFIFLFVFALWLFSLILKKTNFRSSKFYLPLAIYLFAFVCSTVFSINPKFSFVKLFGEIYLIGLAVLSFNLIDSLEKLKKVFFVWFAATFVACLTSLLTFVLFYTERENGLLFYTLSHYGTLPPGNYPRIESTFLNPNMLCNYLSVSFLFLFASINLKWISRNLAFVLLILLSFASIFTISPNLGGIFLSIGLWLWLVFKEKKDFNLARLSFASGILAALLFFLSTLATPIHSETSTFFIKIPLIEKQIEPSSRVLAWKTSLQTVAQYPFFGKGTGTDAAHGVYLNPSGRLEILSDAHQMWLNVAGQTGIFGFFALCFLCLFFVRQANVFSFDSEKSTLQTSLGIAFLSAFLYQGLTGSYEDARHLWVLIGLLASVSENDFPKLPENG
jgi:O-antigen ligase